MIGLLKYFGEVKMSSAEHSIILDKLEDIQNAVDSLHTIQYINGDGMTHSISRDEFFQNQYDTDKRLCKRVDEIERVSEKNLTPKRIVSMVKDWSIIIGFVYLILKSVV